MAWDDGLRPQQRDAAGAPRGNRVLLAGPGTGKTFVLVRRVQHLIEAHGVAPSRITALTFTRAAAAEMRQRLEERLGDEGRRVRVSTIHSYALREILRSGAKQLPSPLRVVGDWEERHIVVEELARILKRTVPDISNTNGSGALDLLADDWDTLSADGEGWEAGHPDPQFLSAWRRHREVYGYTLRSELVYQLLTELRSNPDFKPSRESDVILVDEYQDLNRCEIDAVQYLVARSDAEIFAAGDDDQSIYSFRHAHPAGIRHFDETYPGAERSTLTECLRCGPDIVSFSNWLIAQELDRVTKTLVSVTDWDATLHLLRFDDQQDEAAQVAAIVKKAIDNGTAPEQVLILMKSDTQDRVSRAVQKSLADLGIEAYLPRAKRATSDKLQILIEYLVLAQQLSDFDEPDDLALRALLQLEDNGIGAARINKFVTFAFDEHIRFREAIEVARKGSTAFPSKTYAAVVAEVDRILEVARQLAPLDDEDFETWLIRVVEILKLPQEDFDVVYLAAHQIAAELEDTSDEEMIDAEDSQGADVPDVKEDEVKLERRDFLQDLVVAMTGLGDTLPATDPGFVTITSMHGAKGLDADVVIVLQVEDEVIPGEAVGVEMDEARRLLYVSVSRAKRQLLVTACHQRTGPQRYVGQREIEPRTLSRFVRDFGLVAVSIEEYLLAGQDVKGSTA